MNLSRRLKAHRAKLGESQRVYAERVGLHYRTIQNIEDGETPSVATLRILSQDMNVQVDKLLILEDPVA